MTHICAPEYTVCSALHSHIFKNFIALSVLVDLPLYMPIVVVL